VGELLAHHRLHGDLARVVMLEPDDSTPINRGLIEDLFFHYYLWEAQPPSQARRLGGVYHVLKDQPRLWLEPGCYALRSIVRDAIGTAVRRDDRETLLLLRRELGAARAWRRRWTSSSKSASRAARTALQRSHGEPPIGEVVRKLPPIHGWIGKR